MWEVTFFNFFDCQPLSEWTVASLWQKNILRKISYLNIKSRAKTNCIKVLIIGHNPSNVIFIVVFGLVLAGILMEDDGV